MEPNQWASADEVSQRVSREFNSYKLSSAGDGVISWNAPDGHTYFLDPRQASNENWLTVRKPNSGEPVMAFRPRNGVDSELVLSLVGSNSLTATLLVSDNDKADRVFYFATDGGNDGNNPLEVKAFTLRASGITDSPIGKNKVFYILIVKV